jgi:RNA polymerase sigma-70 factor (ECF subfamily)
VRLVPGGSAGSAAADATVGAEADAALVRALHDEHAPALYSFCLGFTGDRQRAEDVVQEVLVRAWRHAATLRRDARPVRPWLFTTARNLLTDAHRAELTRPRLLPSDAEVGDVAARDDIGRAVESWTVAEALQGLSAEHREVLVQAHWMGRSVTEIAEVLGLPAGTVKSRTYYAVRALRLALEEKGLG